MGLGRIAERELAIDSQSQLPLRDPGEHFPGAPEQLIALRRVMREARACQIHTILRQTRWIERRHRPAGLSEEREKAAPPHAVQTFIERRLADRVVNNVYAAAVCQTKCLRLEVALLVIDDVVGPGLAC